MIQYMHSDAIRDLLSAGGSHPTAGCFERCGGIKFDGYPDARLAETESRACRKSGVVSRDE